MELNRIPNSGNDPRLRYDETRQTAQSQDTDRVRGARQALVRLSELRAAQLKGGRESENQTRVEESRNTERGGSDQIEISDRARIMAGELDKKVEAGHDERAREAKIKELKTRLEQAGINTPDAMQRAAESLLKSKQH